MLAYDSNESSNDFDITICLLLIIVVITEVLFGVNKADSVSLALIYVLGTILISYLTSGYHFGIASAMILSFLYHSYEPINQDDDAYQEPILFGVMLFTLFTASFVISRMKSKAEIAKQKASRSDLMYDINQKLLTANDLNTIIDCALSYAHQQIGRDIVFYTEDPLISGSGIFSDIDSELNTNIQRTNAHKYFIDPDTGATPYSDSVEFFYYPVKTNNNISILMGIFFRYSSISKNDVFFIRDLMQHVSIAAELQSISYMKHKADIDSERERVKNTLLRSVSHDLRTPLTAILGESTLIAEHADNLEIEDIKLYGNDIKENSEWLIRMVENLLMVTRITGDSVNIKKINGDVEEIMAHAVSIVRKRYPNSNISVDATSNPIYVNMDATLMTQVLINLLDNAVKYSPEGSPVKLKLLKGTTYIRMIVSDEGTGISEELLSNIMDDKLIEMKCADSKTGFGLGLTICKTIIKAHSGMMEIRGNDWGGTEISVYIPL